MRDDLGWQRDETGWLRSCLDYQLRQKNVSQILSWTVNRDQKKSVLILSWLKSQIPIGIPNCPRRQEFVVIHCRFYHKWHKPMTDMSYIFYLSNKLTIITWPACQIYVIHQTDFLYTFENLDFRIKNVLNFIPNSETR